MQISLWQIWWKVEEINKSFWRFESKFQSLDRPFCVDVIKILCEAELKSGLWKKKKKKKKSLTRCFAFFLTSIFFLDGFASCGPGWTIVYLEIPGLGSSGPTELRPQVLRRNSWDAAGDTPFNVSFIPIDNFISTVFHIKKVAVKKLFGKVPENDISRRLKKYKSHNG